MRTNISSSRRRWLLGATAGLAAGVAGCGGGGLDDDVRLRVVNATVDVPLIDVDYNGWTFAYDVRQGGDTSRYDTRALLLIGGFGVFEVFRSGDSRRLFSSNRRLPQADSASVVVMGSRSDTMQLRLIDEDANGPASGANLRLRVLHALPDQAALDVHLSVANAPLSGRPAEWALDGFDDLSAFVEVPAGSRLRVTPRGNPQRVLFDSLAFSMAGGSVANLVLAPAASRGRIAVALLPQGGSASLLLD